MKNEIRLVATQACNFDCYFCHHEGVCDIKEAKLTLDDYEFLFKVAKNDVGINTVTITGGEPLLLKNIVELTKRLNDLGYRITIVTNGSLLGEKIEVINYVSQLNISLHSLDKEEYEQIVGRKNVFDTVIENIKLVRTLNPDIVINLNYALINSSNLKERIDDVIVFAKENKVNVKFIELFPKNCDDFYPIEELHKYLALKGYDLKTVGDRKNEFIKDNSKVFTTKCLCSRALDFNSPSNFCNKNNDLFMTQDGNIKLCRIKDDTISLYDEITNKEEDNLVKKLNLSLNELGSGCPYDKK